jgi:hypothetical protein
VTVIWLNHAGLNHRQGDGTSSRLRKRRGTDERRLREARWRSLDPTGRGRARWINRWKPALNAFAVTFEGRIEIND